MQKNIVSLKIEEIKGDSMDIIEKDGHMTLRMKSGFDAHAHFRELDQLFFTVPYSARQFACAVAMPNTFEPLTCVRVVILYQRSAEKYGQENDQSFRVIVPIYLTDEITPMIMRTAHAAGICVAKLYPMGATTQSHKGVTAIEKLFPVLSVMQDLDMILSVHCEVTDANVDFFDRERVFIHRHLSVIAQKFPSLRIIIEHVSTKDAVQFVMDASDRIAATITPQHIMLNRNHLFMGGLQPHNFCFPIINSAEDQMMVSRAIFHRRFFLGTDSAPHGKYQKYYDGKGGCFTSPYALELYAHAFEKLGALEILEDFSAIRGPDFYGFAPSENMVQLTRAEGIIAQERAIGAHTMAVPFLSGHMLNWRYDAAS